jgi:hypothetical protein
VDEIFPSIDTSNIDGILTVLILDNVKELIIDAAINKVINYLEKFIALCFEEEHIPLICSVDYVVLPKLQRLIIQSFDLNIKPRESLNFQLIGIDQQGDKIESEQKVNWKATGGSIDRKGKLTVNSKSQGVYKVRAIVGNSLNVSANYNVLPKSSDLTTLLRLANPDLKQQETESKSSWSATGGEIYSAEVENISTSPQLINPDLKQQETESKSSWSATGGEIYSAEVENISTSPQLINPGLKQQDTESKAFWSAKGGKIYSAEIGSLPTFIFYISKTNSSN